MEGHGSQVVEKLGNGGLPVGSDNDADVEAADQRPVTGIATRTVLHWAKATSVPHNPATPLPIYAGGPNSLKADQRDAEEFHKEDSSEEDDPRFWNAFPLNTLASKVASEPAKQRDSTRLVEPRIEREERPPPSICLFISPPVNDRSPLSDIAPNRGPTRPNTIAYNSTE